jgi:hypothetical protein
MITVIGIFEDVNLAEQVCEYLLGNEFTDEQLDIHTHGNSTDHETDAADRISSFFNHLFDDEDEARAHATAGSKGTIVTVHAPSARLAQEAVDALNNHGAIDVNAFDENPGTGTRSRLVERVVDEDKRLKGI